MFLFVIFCASLPAMARAQENPRLDRYGDPLPSGAVLRLGTVRLRHHGVIRVAYSSDGKTIASAGFDGTVRVWDAATGKEIRRFGKPGEANRGVAVFSVGGKLLAFRSPNGSVRVWETATGKQLLEIQPDQSPSTCLAFSPDGRVLFVGRQDGTIRRWEVVSGKELAPLLFRQGPMEVLAISPDGKLLAAIGGGAQPILLWDLATADSRHHLLRPRGQALFLAFSPDGKMLISTASDESPHLWDVTTGKVIRLLGPAGSSVAFSPDGKTVAIGSGNQVRRWDLKSGQELLPRLKASRDGVASLSFSPDGAFLAAAGGGSAIHVWDLARAKEAFGDRGSQGRLLCLAFSPDGKTIATGDRDSRVRLWDRSGKELRALSLPNTWADAIAFTPDGRTLATGSFDKHIRLWDVAGGKLLREWPTSGTNFLKLAFTPDGKTLASANAQDGLRLWEVATGKQARHFPAPSPFSTVAISPNGRLLAACVSGRVRLWEMATGEELLRLPVGGSSDLAPLVAFSADSTILCAGDRGRETPVVWWDVKTGRETQRLRLPDQEQTTCYALSPDGRTLAVGSLVRIPGKYGTSHRPSLALWEVRTGQVRRQLAAGQGRLGVLAFAADGVLASAGEDTTVLVWEGTRPITALAGSDRLSPEEVKARWAALGDRDAVRAYDAVCDLARSPRAAVAWLTRALVPVRPADRRRLTVLLRELASARFTERDRASGELEDLAEAAEPALREALKTPLAEESRRRVERLLEKLDPLKSAKRLRALRAVEVLEGIGSAEARRLLEELAGGIAEASLTQEARAALARLDRRRGP
jgi:WD40 repeat protein